LLKQNLVLKNNFEIFNKTKENLYKQLLIDLKHEQENSVKMLFEDKIKLFNYVKSIEQTEKKYIEKDKANKHKLEDLKTALDRQENENLLIKEQIMELEKEIRHVPPEQKFYLEKHENKSYNGHLVKF